MIREAINIAVLAIYLLLAVDAEASEPTPDELRDLLVDSIILDLQGLGDIEGTNQYITNITNKSVALINSYETTIQAHVKVILRLKELLDENQIKITYR